MYRVTIYSPADREEHLFNCKTTADLDKVVTGLTSSMESGAWFKVEKT
jgi:hypothetical protein